MNLFKPFLAVGVAAGITLGIASSALAVPSVGPASVWSSLTPQVPPIFGVGGTGQINGEFQLDTVTTIGTAMNAIQIGLRAQRRLFGPDLPRTGSTYTALAGESDPGLATWNYDIHLDFGTSFLATELGIALTPMDMRDFDINFDFDIDPTAGINFVTTNISSLLGAELHLLQLSQNIGFASFGGPLGTGPGIYDYRLTVTPIGSATAVASTSMRVNVVPEPGTLAIMGLGLVGLGIARRRKRA